MEAAGSTHVRYGPAILLTICVDARFNYTSDSCPIILTSKNSPIKQSDSWGVVRKLRSGNMEVSESSLDALDDSFEGFDQLARKSVSVTILSGSLIGFGGLDHAPLP